MKKLISLGFLIALTFSIATAQNSREPKSGNKPASNPGKISKEEGKNGGFLGNKDRDKKKNGGFLFFGKKDKSSQKFSYNRYYDRKIEEYYDRMEEAAKRYKKMQKEMQKPQYSDPLYFGHKNKPKKRPPGKKKFCAECGIVH